MTKRMEEWRHVVGFETLYEVSNKGNIRRFRSHRVMKRQITPDGYERVELRIGGTRWSSVVHKLVAMAFIGPMPPGREVNHKDLNKKNNNASNLEYVTHAENMIHALRAGVFNKRMRAVVRREDGVVFESIHAAARDVGAAVGNLWRTLKNRRGACKGFHFSYYKENQWL